MQYDIVVVGAGPAGASAGGEAAKLGAKVLTVERKKIIGEPVQCAEFVPRLLSEEVAFTTKSVAQKVESMRTYLFNGECFEMKSPGYILNRKVFDKELIEDGVDVLTNTVCVSKTAQGVLIKMNGTNVEVYAKIIIGADGPKSTVGSWIGEVNRDFITALQYEMPLVHPTDYTEIYFDSEFVGGYGWLFPKGKTANVGVGVKKSKIKMQNLKSLLESFIERLKKMNKIEGEPISTTGGLIPVGGALNTVKDNIILVGDAAGQTHPITGGGIPQAIVCGKIAGRAAAKAIKKNNLNVLLEYKEEWNRIFGQELKRGCIKRKFLDNQWEKLTSENLRKCWPAFKEYYDE